MRPTIGLGWWTLLLLALWASYARAQQCTEATLHAEFFQDPTQRAYVTCAADGNLAGEQVDDNCVLQKFNEPCTVTACKVDNILSAEIILQTLVDSAELEKLARSTNANDAARRAQLSWLMEIPSFNLSKASWQQKWKNVFVPADSPLTNAAINNAQLKDAPRSEIVCHRQGNLSDVSCGLRGTGCP